MVIAGPNGSGKSSVYKDANLEFEGQSIWIINPDLLTLRIQSVEGLSLPEANLQAVKRIEVWLEASLSAHQSVGVETVLSTDKYRRLVHKAKSLGFRFHFFYVLLESVERNVERVALRVKKGGHGVSEEKIRARHSKSLAQMPWFLEQADKAWVSDNSGADPRFIAEKNDGDYTLFTDPLPEVRDAIEQIAQRRTS